MTSDAVLAAARGVLSADRGASLDEVARAAGVSRATVYRLFGSRDGLLQALDLEPEAGARERALAAGLELVSRDGLARLSMDEVAVAAGISRASLYRLFPGKAALFRALVETYSPLEAIQALLERLRGQPPEEVMPEIARTATRALAGRVGVVRTLLFEVTSASEESAEAASGVVLPFVMALAQYLTEQMAAGRLRPMHPVLAVQSFAGPLLLHVMTRGLAERLPGAAPPLEEAVSELARSWVSGMRPEPAGEER
jgi:AcrR family transcriptional regulator